MSASNRVCRASSCRQQTETAPPRPEAGSACRPIRDADRRRAGDDDPVPVDAVDVAEDPGRGLLQRAVLVPDGPPLGELHQHVVRPARRDLRDLLPELPLHRLDGDHRPAHHLLDGGLRVRRAGVPRQAHPVRPDPGDPDHSLPGGPGAQLRAVPVPALALQRQRQLDRHEPSAVGLGLLRRGLRDLPAAPVLPDDSERPGRRRARRRRQPLADLPADLRPARPGRPWRPWPSSSSCGAGTTCWTR